MYNDRLYLTAQTIFDQDFKIDARGYRPQEVDKFLDMVISDYTEFDNIIKKLESDLQRVSDENMKLKQEVRRLQGEIATAPKEVPSRTQNNVDLLKRISNLERTVYGSNNE